MSKHERFPELTDDEPGDARTQRLQSAPRTPGKGGFARLFGIGTLLLLLGLLALGAYSTSRCTRRSWRLRKSTAISFRAFASRRCAPALALGR